MEKTAIERRRNRMMINALPNMTFAILTISVLWIQEGWELFQTPVFFVILMWWLYTSFFSFYMRWGEAKDKTTDEKIDELIAEIKTDREQRIKEASQDEEE